MIGPRLRLLPALLLLALCLSSCGTDARPPARTGTSPGDGGTAPPPDEPPSGTAAAGTGTAAESETETETGTGTEPPPDLRLDADRLGTAMLPILDGDVVRDETVLFLERGTSRGLLFTPDRVLSVTSYDGSQTYEEGRDYELRDGKLYLPETSTIPCITEARYYGAGEDSLLRTIRDGRETPTHWGEGRAMTDWQVCVTYTHSDRWEGARQECLSDRYGKLIAKMRAGEDVTVVCYGDSIVYGAASSFVYGYGRRQDSFALLLTRTLADLFGYRVEYVSPDLPDTAPVPPQPYNAGGRGVLTYVNPSVGGWNSSAGLRNADRYLEPFLNLYGCDLFVLAFDDGSAISVRGMGRTMGRLIDRALDASPGASVLMISSMVPNPEAVGWYRDPAPEERELLRQADRYMERGVPCGVARMSSISRSILQRKDFLDYTGNNINHPNDFFSRVYAQTLLQTLIGYGHIGGPA